MKKTVYSLMIMAAMVLMTACSTSRQLAESQARTARLEQNIDSLTSRMNAISQQMTQMQEQLKGLSQQVSSSKTQIVTPTPSTPTVQPVTPVSTKKWDTSYLRGAKASVEFGGKTYKATCTITSQWDSIVVISISLVFGIEVARVEATPTEVIVINKLEKEYDRAPYSEINKQVRPFVTYEDLRTIAGGEMPSVAENGVLRYSAVGKTVALAIDFQNKPIFNQPVSISRLDISRYKKIKLLK
jgi:uncharacterized coiled-coil protein SlyX